MDRNIVYVNSIPQDTDLLTPQVSIMSAIGYLAEAVLGAATTISGMAVAPTVPPSMSVQIGRGMLSQTTVVDNSAFGSVPADSHTLVKMGLMPDVFAPTFVAPTITGQSQIFLIEASLIEADVGSTVLPYYNAANPVVSFAGPNGSGVPQNTQRTQRVNIQVRAGAAVATGTALAPSVDVGFVPLALVTINAGQTTITASSIIVHPSSPALQFNLPALTPGFANMRVFTASGQYQLPVGIKRARVRAWGAGGSGGSSTSLSYPGGGGGAGGYVEGWIVPPLSNVLVFTVGAAVIAQNGGGTLIGPFTANGGMAGQNGSSGGVGLGGSGGAVTGYDPTQAFAVRGGDGSSGIVYTATTIEGGRGAAGHGSSSQSSVGTSAAGFNGNVGYFPSGGASGGTNASAMGGGGCLIVEW